MEIQIRLARQCDMQSIVEMSKGIYEGHDYFPHVFLRWLDDSKRRILVAEKGDVIIGLRAFHVVDDGKTVVSQSLRVHPEYRGQGISALLIRAAQEYVQAYFPSVRTERYTTMSSNVPRLAIQRKTGLDSLVLELGLVAFYVDPVNAGTRFENGPPCSFFKQTTVDDAPVVRPLSFDEFRDLLEGVKLDGVVWRNTLIVDWEPFEAHPSNFFNGLIMDGDFLLASANTGSAAAGVGSMSHGRLSPRVKYRHWVATIYTCDEKLLKVHVAKQLECAILQQRTAKETFVFSCFLPKSLVSCAKDYLTNEFSLEYVDFLNFNLLLFEKDFPS